MTSSRERAAALVELFGRFGPLYMRWVGANLPADGVSYPRLKLLAALYEGGPQSMRSLTRSLGVSPQNVSVLIDALETQGMIERRADPDDRRVTIVRLSAGGRRTVADEMAAHRSAVAELFVELGADEQRQLERTLQQLIEALERRRDAQPLLAARKRRSPSR